MLESHNPTPLELGGGRLQRHLMDFDEEAVDEVPWGVGVQRLPVQLQPLAHKGRQLQVVLVDLPVGAGEVLHDLGEGEEQLRRDSRSQAGEGGERHCVGTSHSKEKADAH